MDSEKILKMHVETAKSQVNEDDDVELLKDEASTEKMGYLEKKRLNIRGDGIRGEYRFTVYLNHEEDEVTRTSLNQIVSEKELMNEKVGEPSPQKVVKAIKLWEEFQENMEEISF